MSGEDTVAFVERLWEQSAKVRTLRLKCMPRYGGGGGSVWIPRYGRGERGV